MASDYVRGEMNIADQKATFGGFISVTVWGSLLTIVSVLYLTLVFAVGIDWLVGLVATAIVGGVLGLALGMKTSWYVTLGGLFVFGLVCGGIVQLFGMVIGG